MRDIILMDSQRPDDTQPLDRERIHLLLLDDARCGMKDIAAGRTEDADATHARLQKSRAEKFPASVAEHPYAAELAASLQRLTPSQRNV